MTSIERNSRGQVRCVWAADAAPCSKVGRGNPPLCRRHYALAIAGGSERPRRRSPVVDAHLDHVFDRVDDAVAAGTDRLVAGLFMGIGGLVERITRPGAFVRAPGGVPRSDARRPRGTAPPRQPPRPAASDQREDPRDVLGFEPGVPLTRALIKDRQRALLSVIHPDHGGSNRAAQRIIDAARRLLEETGT